MRAYNLFTSSSGFCGVLARVERAIFRRAEHNFGTDAVPKMCTRERNKKFCNSSIDDGIYIEYATRANTRIVVLAHANSQMQVRRFAVARVDAASRR